ncbi:hypothetical protein E2562_011104 [Oryza meyeriana var. granulata]|uniref:Uncharacterized protein n=1 Tax=Oryza meyeriana var. granulata TaxID=110450 RepID=A0A6G1EWK0_9ORYZ|nr:hypothetical protein E2562_011104 [Oryza meyeriana var. granulata]
MAIFLEDDEEEDVEVPAADPSATTSTAASVGKPSSGTVAKRVRATYDSKAPAPRNAKPKETKKITSMLRKAFEHIVDERYGRILSAMREKTGGKDLLRREKVGRGYDPLVIEDFHWDNKRADSLYEPVEGARGCDITWDDVDEAIGASCALRGRNVPRRAHNNAEPITFERCSRNHTRIMIIEDEEQDPQFHQGVDEEENPHDDASVRDYDENPIGIEDGEENMDASDEFGGIALSYTLPPKA